MAAARKSGHGATPAVAALERASVRFTLRSYEHHAEAASFGAEAVDALGLDSRRVLKTLVSVVDGDLVVGVVPVATQLDLKALAGAVGGKRAALADPAAAQRATGYVVGGISPLGQRRRLPTVVDAGVGEFDTVFVSAGRRGLQVELSPKDLVALTAAVVAPIGR